jgi:hypothetical protein
MNPSLVRLGAAVLWLSLAGCRPAQPGGDDDEHLAPVFTEIYQSATTAVPGETVTFEVSANDPENNRLTFEWSASAGTLVERLTTATSSMVDWTVSSCGNGPSVTVVVSNTYGLSASTTFAFTQLPSCAWVSTGQLGTARTGITATRLPSGKVLITGGVTARTDIEYLSSTELYDPATRSWSAAAPLSVRRYAHTATLLRSGQVLVTGGSDFTSGPTLDASTELYDPTTDSWSAGPPMGTSRYGHTATLLDSGKVLVVTGIGRGTAEEYDPASRTWSPASVLTAPRYSHTATLLPSGEVLVTGGIVGNTATASAELYDPGTRTWSATTPMAAARYGHNAILLPSGKVLVTGGYATSPLSSAELYDPASHSWTAVPSMIVPRMEHAAALLPSGKVLVAGGRNGLPTTSAEVYDPATNTWSSADFMRWRRDRPVAVPLASGQILIVGGYTGHNLDYATVAEVYSP